MVGRVVISPRVAHAPPRKKSSGPRRPPVSNSNKLSFRCRAAALLLFFSRSRWGSDHRSGSRAGWRSGGLRVAAHAFLEAAHALAKALHDLWDFLATEQNYDYRSDD